MITVIGIALLFGTLFITALYPLSSLAWSILIGASLLVVTLFHMLPQVLLVICWIVFLFALAFTHLHTLRQRYLWKPFVSHLKNKLPAVSATEQAAIDAGDTWWEKELFCGRPDWNKLFEFPRPSLTLEEQSYLDNQVENLCNMLNDWDIVQHKHDLPPAVWDYLKKEKFFAMVIPKEYGGLGFSALAHSSIVTKIATSSLSAAVTAMVPNSLGPGELLLRYGTTEQKNEYLPRLANGTDIPCFALTAPDAGSDAGSMSDRGIVCYGMYQGQRVLGIELSFDKRYITLAPVATLLGLAIQLYDPEHLIGDQTNIGITVCLIPTSHPGVEIGTRHLPMYSAFMNGPTRGNDIFIPLDWIIGGQPMAGQGWRMLMECLSVGRSISLPALSTACGKLSYRLTGAYARIRKQFNTPISQFEGVEDLLGQIAGYTYILEACRMMTASAVDQDINPAIVSAIAKYHMTELSRQIVSHAMDIHAGHMVQVGPRNPLANAYLTMPISITVEGANILTRNLIIFGQGAIRCHPYILSEVSALSRETVNAGELDQLLMSHIRFLFNNFIRTFVYGLTGGIFIISPVKNKKIAKRVKQLTRMSSALAFISDISLILLGGSLKRREKTSARLGDILSQLYLASTVLKYFNDHHKPQSDIEYVSWNLQMCLYKIQLACDQLFNNYPIKWIGGLLKFIVFPFGRAYQQPSDKLTHKLVESMTMNCELRDRLSRFLFIKNDSLIEKLDLALEKIPALDPTIKKMNKKSHHDVMGQLFHINERITAAEANDIISDKEANDLRHYFELYNDIIQVDEFSFTLDNVQVQSMEEKV